MTIDLPKPALTVDTLLFSPLEGVLKVLLIRRKNSPFRGFWAIPGGFVDAGETPQQAAVRELAEETGVRGVEVHEFGSFGEPGRDPRGWTVSVAYLALVVGGRLTVQGGDDAAEADWHPADDPPALAFDHSRIVARGVESLRERLLMDPIAAPLLPRTFSWAEFRAVYEVLFGKRLDRRRLLRLALSTGLLQRCGAGSDKVRYRFGRRRLIQFFDSARPKQL